MQASTLLASGSLRPINPGGMRRRVGTLAPLLLAAVAVSSQTGASSPDLSQYRNKNRLLFVFAPNDKDTRYTQQFSKFAGKADGFKERDLVRFDVFENGTSRRDGIGPVCGGEGRPAAAVRHYKRAVQDASGWQGRTHGVQREQARCGQSTIRLDKLYADAPRRDAAAGQNRQQQNRAE